MLKQRIITASWLLPLMLGMLFFAPGWLWAAFAALITLLTLREYARMSGMGQRQANHYLAATALFLLAAYTGGWMLAQWIWWVVLAFWFVLAPAWLRKKWTLDGGWQAYAAGWVMIVPFWFALVSLRPTPVYALPLLAVMGLVWVADIAAYFFGKAFGRNKLAPAISPGKSWEGAFGGAACAAVYMGLVWQGQWLAFDTGFFATVFIGLVLTAVSVAGDLLESWFKRASGMKDSSSLLPGHGGVFDRVDSLIAVVCVYAAILAVW